MNLLSPSGHVWRAAACTLQRRFRPKSLGWSVEALHFSPFSRIFSVQADLPRKGVRICVQDIDRGCELQLHTMQCPVCLITLPSVDPHVINAHIVSTASLPPQSS